MHATLTLFAMHLCLFSLLPYDIFSGTKTPNNFPTESLQCINTNIFGIKTVRKNLKKI